ncbi:MAG: sugar phosphate isomerase/epimerase [Selenomonadaceae bacterium]|nr:sugar phosphate isomerase/epimerase [Selenomonadaceae bacterium]
MQILCSTDGIVNGEFPKPGIRNIVKGGFSDIILNISKYALDYDYSKYKSWQEYRIYSDPQKLKKLLKPVLDACIKDNLSTPAAYINFQLSKMNTEDNLTDTLIKLGEEAAKIAIDIGCKYLIVSPLSVGIAGADTWAINRQYYSCLAEIIKDHQITILLENQTKNLGGHLVRGLCSDEVDTVKWIDSLNEAVGKDLFGFNLDVGTCNLCGQDMQEFILTLGHRLKMVTLRDNDGNQESSMLPFTAVGERSPRANWQSLIYGLRGIDFDGLFVVQMEDTAIVFSTLIRSELIRLSKTIAEYIAWQVSIETRLKKYKNRVLFGAGNMCRGYMECYGREYPPLFTCDNNKSLWNTECCGLKVKAPEELKNIPEDCAIFICNIYYAEIEKQLHDMDIKNPIERFSDEYLPSYHFNEI